MVARDLTCATCHQEHKGGNFKLNKISDEQCRSCHVVKFDSFDGNHPKFDTYPFKRRTRIVYDHAGHFGKHYPELAKKDPAKPIPATCSTCHNSGADKRIMTVAPFEQTCATCHLDQITGKARVSGPKGIAFLTLPGLDLQSLKKKNAAIGEWPDASDAALSPFMKVMISRNEQGRALIKTVDNLKLQDLADASDDQIKAVTGLVWEIKTLFHALMSGKASDVLGDLNIGGGAKLSAALVADLTASIPRDVIISAQQQWLPNLAAEMAKGPVAGKQEEGGWSAVTSESTVAEPAPAEPLSEPKAADKAPESGPEPSPDAAASDTASVVKRDPPACMVRVLGQCLAFKEAEAAAENLKPEGAIGITGSENAKAKSRTETVPARALPPAMRAGVKDAGTSAQPEAAAGKTAAANTPPPGKAGDQSDDLLFPTEDELREIKARTKDTGTARQPEDAASKSYTANAARPAGAAADAAARSQTTAAPVISIDSGTDPESWAEYGGWYRQDYGIFYRPTGHKDKFIYSWLFLTGPQAPQGTTSPAAAVFDFLTSKDAQGSCTKCHSVDDFQNKGRIVNFSPASVESKQGRFTTFVHEPHFGIMDNRGCLTCHSLEKGKPGAAAAKADTANAAVDDAVSADAAFKATAAAPAEASADSSAAAASTDAEKGVSPYLKSYEQGNPQSFAANFGGVKKDLCQTCHTSSKARQDCLLCHKYHVNDVIAPIMKTKIPTQ